MGIGIPLFFVPLMTISMTSVTPQETAAASGLINFLRTIAGAIATAVTVSAWSTDAASSRSDLVGRLNVSRDLMTRLEDRGLGVNQALHSLDGLVESQSIMLATNHMFLLLGAVVGITALGVWLMPRPMTN
jgi:DHA2 family multidrug resistance protein